MNISELQQFTYACKELNKPGFYPLSEKAKQCNNDGHKHFECLDCWKLEKVEGFNMIHLHTKANPVGVIAKFVDKENDQGVFVVAYRGTQNAGDWLTNLNFRKRFHIIPRLTRGKYSRVQYHADYYSRYELSREWIFEKFEEYDCKHIVFAGHSMGGAIATIAAIETGSFFKPRNGIIHSHELKDLKPSINLVTFGTTRAGKADIICAANRNLDYVMNIIRKGDIAPKFPSSAMGYRHITNFSKMTDKPRLREANPLAMTMFNPDLGVWSTRLRNPFGLERRALNHAMARSYIPLLRRIFFGSCGS